MWHSFKKYRHRQIKALAVFYSYIIGAVLFSWILPVDSFYMLFMSYFSLNKHKAWLAINNPSVISWTHYLVMLFIYRDFIVMTSNIQKQLGKFEGAKIKVKFLSVFIEIHFSPSSFNALSFVTDPEWACNVCLVVSLGCCGSSWCST